MAKDAENKNQKAESKDQESKSNAKNDEQKSEAQIKQEAKKETYVQGEEIKGLHLEGEEIEGGTKGLAKELKIELKSGKEVSDVEGRNADRVIVHPHRIKQPHRIEQEFPEVEVIYGDLDEDKADAIAKAKAKGVEYDPAMSADEINSLVDDEESNRQESAEAYDPNYQAVVVADVKTYRDNQLFVLNQGQVVNGDLAYELVDAGYAEERNKE